MTQTHNTPDSPRSCVNNSSSVSTSPGRSVRGRNLGNQMGRLWRRTKEMWISWGRASRFRVPSRRFKKRFDLDEPRLYSQLVVYEQSACAPCFIVLPAVCRRTSRVDVRTSYFAPWCRCHVLRAYNPTIKIEKSPFYSASVERTTPGYPWSTLRRNWAVSSQRSGSVFGPRKTRPTRQDTGRGFGFTSVRLSWFTTRNADMETCLI